MVDGGGSFHVVPAGDGIVLRWVVWLVNACTEPKASDLHTPGASIIRLRVYFKTF